MINNALAQKAYMKLVPIAAAASVSPGIQLLSEWFKIYPSSISLQADVIG